MLGLRLIVKKGLDAYYFNFKNILLCLCLFIGTKSFAETINGINYILSKDEATVTSSEPKYTRNVVIPESITYNGNNYTVKRIGESAFQLCSNLTSITIPNSVTGIEDYAFQGCI